MNEPFVKEKVMTYLSKQLAYTITGYKEQGRHGPDIEARKNDWDFIIEAKGDPDPEGKSSREVYFLQCLGQIVTRMDRLKAARYGIAFPESYKDLLIRRVPWKACQRLSLHLFLVNKDGIVAELDYRAVRALQKSNY